MRSSQKPTVKPSAVGRPIAGEIYNVRSYGARGDGTTDDTLALSTATEKCNRNGGVVFLPPGHYEIRSSLPRISSTACSIQGSGTYASMIETAQAIGDIISVINGPNNAPPRLYTAQFFEHFGVNCNVNADASGPFRNVGFHLIDTVMTKFFDVNVANCRAGIEEENASGDSERNEFINVHLLCNMDGWLFQQDKGNANNSFEHQTWVGNYVSTCNPAGENVFHLVGGAQLLNSYVQFNGNIYGNSTTLFELDGGSALINSTVDVWPEADGTPKQHQYAFGEAGVGPAGFSNACQSNLACVIVSGHISGYLEFQNGSQWAVLHVADPFKVPQHIGTLSTTASTSDTFSSAFIVYQDACFISPMNSSAAAMVSSTFIADVRRGSLVVRHPAIAGATFQVWCN